MVVCCFLCKIREMRTICKTVYSELEGKFQEGANPYILGQTPFYEGCTNTARRLSGSLWMY